MWLNPAGLEKVVDVFIPQSTAPIEMTTISKNKNVYTQWATMANKH